MIDPCLLSNLPLFAQLSPRLLSNLAYRSVERHFAAGQLLFAAGTVPAGLLVVLEGRVRVVRGSGRQHVIHEEGPGGALGEVPVFDGGTYPASAIAGEATRCLLLPSEALRAAVRSSPETSLLFLHRLGERTRHLVDRIHGLAAQDVNARLARLLQARQQAVGPGVPFTLSRTQLETAEELGTVREVVVRALRELREDGIIESAGRGRYLVRDDRRLARLIPV
jgi:CRP-like cAMP-binding protein